MIGGPLRRVSRACPCPVCGRPDWCSVSADGKLCVCMRQAEGAKKRSANGGYVHVLRDDHFHWEHATVRRVRIERQRCGRADLDCLARQYQAAMDPAVLQALTDSLVLSATSLGRLETGWDPRRRAWTFPMRDQAGHVLGIRLRFCDGRKMSVAGGHEGLFLPDGISFAQPLLFPEGPTDCAALLDLGFDAVGRPSCSGGVRHCVELIRTHWPLDVVVVADNDEPGQRGAESLALALLAVARSVRVIQPPDGIKDARAWKLAGARRADVERAIEAAPQRELTVRQSATSTTRGR